MRVLLIGGSGQLGLSIINSREKSKHLSLFYPTSKQLNLSDFLSIDRAFSEFKPELVINCAAYTNVDGAELEKKTALKINCAGVGYLAEKVEEYNSLLIHVSTDYVFGAENTGPYSNEDNTSPINYYGFTKLEGEKEISLKTNNYLIIRTSSLMSHYDGNFAHTIITKLLNNDFVSVIDNQNITVTCADYLSQCIHKICDLYMQKKSIDISSNNIIHYSNLGYTNWFAVADWIKKYLIINKIITDNNLVKPINSAEWVSEAKRPNDSRLAVDEKLFSLLNIKPVSWETNIENVVDNYLLKYKEQK
tara:strand:- start:7197 stop:8111 length:915 start_codon:yes stop_codon:yes gene_type:complete